MELEERLVILILTVGVAGREREEERVEGAGEALERRRRWRRRGGGAVVPVRELE